MEKKFYSSEFNYELTVDKFAGQADGSAWLQQGGTIVLATVVSARSKDFPGFLPLTIDYRENFAAAGKIPGGYYKREGKFSDKEVLVSRLIDRALRPLFPTNYFDQIQIMVTVYSVDKEHAPYTLAVIAASLALSLSKIPFLGPIGAVEVGRTDGQFVLNPLYSQMLKSDVKITVAGTHEGICMVEANTNQIVEKEFVDGLFLAHETIKKQVAWQQSVVEQAGKPKEPIVDMFDWPEWQNRARNFLIFERIEPLFNPNKAERGQAILLLKENFLETYKPEAELLAISTTFLEYVFDAILKDVLTESFFALGKRIDNRLFDTVRPIYTEVGLLPFTHGSAFFQRGRTQALVSVTLGGGQDEQKVEDIMGDTVDNAFMLHYNFQPFSVGEVRAMRGPGRREIGHGHLAAASFKYVLPTREKFPYTIRIVADVLESDGSTSMATACGATMALMNAGVPISAMVSGVAMGLIQSSTGQLQVLTDIAGIEDAFGLMDFKVAGTDQGITAVQMDIKYKGGLHREVFEMALTQAYKGRMHILQKMREVLSVPNPTLSVLVPQIVSFKVPIEKIGAIIGSKGATIKDIIAQTGTLIDIEADGLVKIFGHPGIKLDQAVAWVKTLGGLIEKGTIYQGRIKKLVDFGIFVEIAPGQDGLVHVSALPKNRQTNFLATMKVDDPVTVEVLEYDKATEKIRLKFIENK